MGSVMFLSLLLVMAVTIRAQILHDTDNNPVTTDGRYFIIDKVAWDETGKRIGASHAPQTFAHACPRVAVVAYQDKSSYYRIPITISKNIGNMPPYVYQDSSISITYQIGGWPCSEENPPVWTVDHESPIQDSDIRFGAAPNNALTTFRIQSEGSGYKITHYNTQTKRTDVLGVLSAPELGYKRFVLSRNNRPFVFVLQNVETLFKRSSNFTMIPFYESSK